MSITPKPYGTTQSDAPRSDQVENVHADLSHLLVQPALASGQTNGGGAVRVAARDVVGELFGGLAVAVPSADVQRMQRAVALFWDSARAFGYTPPKSFYFRAAELFYRDGALEEVRLRGLVAVEDVAGEDMEQAGSPGRE
jgi:hypothetical protein